MDNNIFTELGIVVAMAAAVALVMRLLRQPMIIGHIITGVIAGPSLLKIIHADSAFNGLSSIGVALLLFIIGLDLSVRIFSRLGRVVSITTIAQVASVTGIGFVAARLFGFEGLEALIIGLALAMSSTIIIVKLLNDKKETTRLYAQITIGVLLLQDVVATAAKIGLAAKTKDNGSLMSIITLLWRGVGLSMLLYLSSRYLVPRLTRSMESSKELLLLFALGWGLGFATVFERAGFSIEIGALFAGVSLASLPYSSEMASRLKPLRDFFLVIFFITLGQTVVPHKLVGVIGLALVFSAIVLIVKPLIVMICMGNLGYTKRASFKAAVAMSQISEFSLVFVMAAYSGGLVPERANTALTLVALVTFAASTYLIKYDEYLYQKFERHLRMFERKLVKYEQKEGLQHHSMVLFGYRKGGAEFVKTFKGMGHRFVVVDYDPDVIDTLERRRINYLYGDATDPELLDEIDLDRTRLVVSTMSDLKTNTFLAHWLKTHNPQAVFICSADHAEHAAGLYAEGAAYVMLPHYIGSEKISQFLRKNGFNKTEFKRYREKHLAYLQTRFEPANSDT